MDKQWKCYVNKMLTMDFLDKEKLCEQVELATLQVRQSKQEYIVDFSYEGIIASTIPDTVIRMDSFPTADTLFVFELYIKEGKLHELHIFKMQDEEKVLFDLDEVCLKNIMYAYDITLFANRKYLPIGTVVSLQKGIKKFMIYGRRVKHAEDNKVYDYVGCLYPEGIRDFHRTILFDHSQITKLHCIGMEGIEETKMLALIEG